MGRTVKSRSGLVSAEQARAEILADPVKRAFRADLIEREQWIETLRNRRIALGMTTGDVAERVRMSVEWVEEFEVLQTDPHLSDVQRYARAVGVRLSVSMDVET